MEALKQNQPLPQQPAKKSTTSNLTDQDQGRIRIEPTQEKIDVNSRSELLAKQQLYLEEISKENTKPVQDRDFQKLQNWRILLTALEDKIDKVPDIIELRRQVDGLTFQIELAASVEEYEKAKLLQKDLNTLESKIRRIAESGPENRFVLNPSDVEVLKTRVSLEAKLLQLEEDYEKAFNEKEFDKAKGIVNEIKLLEEARSQKHTLADYVVQINELKSELENAKSTKNIEAAVTINKRLVEVEAKAKQEEEAEIALGIKVDVDGTIEMVSPPPPSPLLSQQGGHVSDQASASLNKNEIGKIQANTTGLSGRRMSAGQRSTGRGGDPIDDIGTEQPGSTPEWQNRVYNPFALQSLCDAAIPIDDSSRKVPSRETGDAQQEQPGAVAIAGLLGSREEDNSTTTEVPQTVSSSDNSFLTPEAHLVSSLESVDMEQRILDVLQRNAVQAVTVEKVDTANTSGRKGFAKFFKAWGKNKYKGT